MPESHSNHPTRRLRTALLIGIPILIVLILAAIIGPRVYAASENSKAEAAPTVSLPVQPSADGSTPATTGSPAPTTTLSGQWTAQPGSYAGYRVAEVLNGADVTVTGRTEKVTAEVQVSETQLTSARITVDMASVATDSTRRDNYFRQSALQTDQYPQASFVSTGAVDLATLNSGTPAQFRVPGELTIHGVTRPVTLDLQAALSGDRVQLAGSAPLTFADYQVTAPDLGFVKVESAGQIEFSLALARG